MTQSQLLLSDHCESCPRSRWCAQTIQQKCVVPSREEEAWNFYAEAQRRLTRLGGIEPKALPPVTVQPRLPEILHLHARSCYDVESPWATPFGIVARYAVHLNRGCAICKDYLSGRGLGDCPKALVITAPDDWLIKFVQSLTDAFFSSVKEIPFTAIIGPNFSAYPNADHRVWLENRAISQNVMSRMLRAGLPGIFFTYLEDAPVHQEWLLEYFKMNPTQHYIATGFDRGGANDAGFVERRLQMLREIEDSLGRELIIVLSNMLTRIDAVRYACRLFPGRVRLVAGSVMHRSIQGSRAALEDGKLRWEEWEDGQSDFPRERALFEANSRLVDRHLRSEVPELFSAAT